MGVFYTDSNETSIVNNKAYMQEIKEIAKECRELTKGLPKDRFPDYLWSASINEFENDDYKLRGTCTNPNVLRAYTLGRKYSDYWDYLEAMEIYYAYVDYIDASYGSFEMMKRADEDGYGAVYIPKKPKLSNKKKNKNLIKANFLPSRVDFDAVADEEDIDITLQEIPMRSIDFSENVQLNKVDKRLQKQMLESKSRNDRVRGIYASYGNASQGMDAIVKFLSGSEKYDFDASNKESFSFAEEIETLHEFDFIPDEVLNDAMTPSHHMIIDGMLQNPKKYEQLMILEELEKNGYDFLKTGMTAGMDRRAIRMITKKYGTIESREDLSPKQLKKLKKKEAKRRKRQKDSIVADRRLQDTLLQNKIHLSGSPLDFRLSDVIPEYD